MNELTFKPETSPFLVEGGTRKVQFPLALLKNNLQELETFDLRYLQRLTNKVGIIQHAVYNTPDYRHGYSLDDQVRALMLAVVANEVTPTEEYKNLIHTYLAYINFMKADGGNFRNFLSFDHQLLDEKGTEDSYGRTMMALGFTYKTSSYTAIDPIVSELYRFGLKNCQSLRSVRAAGYALLGLIYYLQRDPGHQETRGYIQELASFIQNEYLQASRTEWPWFEEIISYDNAILPLSLLRASRILGDPQLAEIGVVTGKFIVEECFTEGLFSPVGNDGWWKKGHEKPLFGQQPVEIPSTLLLLEELFYHTQDKTNLKRMLLCFQWFFGHNLYGLPLYDPITTGCKDGIDAHGVNHNQGAESVVSFWLAYAFMRYPYN